MAKERELKPRVLADQHFSMGPNSHIYFSEDDKRDPASVLRELIGEDVSIGNNTIVKDTSIGRKTKVWHNANLYSSRIGKECNIGSYTEIGGSEVGDRCRIEAYCYMPPGVKIGDRVFLGPRATFTNDKYPKAVSAEWKQETTVVGDDVTIGAGAVILSGIEITGRCVIGAGAVVTKDLLGDYVYVGNPAEAVQDYSYFERKRAERLKKKSA